MRKKSTCAALNGTPRVYGGAAPASDHRPIACQITRADDDAAKTSLFEVPFRSISCCHQRIGLLLLIIEKERLKCKQRSYPERIGHPVVWTYAENCLRLVWAHQERDGDQATKLITPWLGRAGIPMTIFTDRELEFIAGLWTNWERLYLREIARLLNGADKNVLRSSSTDGANVVRL
jgi:hypothetical protein